MKNVFIFIFILFFISPKIDAQNITTFAGGGTVGIGDGGAATAAIIQDPISIVFDKLDNCFVASGLGGNRIRRIDASGIISTIAGTGIAGYSGDGFAATSARLNIPSSLAFDTSGNLYICDAGNNAVRKIDILTGVITTIAGTGIAGYNGDLIPATIAKLNNPQDICFDKFNNLYVADANNSRIRKIGSSGIITTIAGIGSYGFSGDNGPATTAQLWIPWRIALDDTGNLYISDQSNFRIRKVNTSGIISTFAGNGTGTYIGDGIPATNAQFNPAEIEVDTSNNLYIGDNNTNFRVLKVDNTGIIHSIAGSGVLGFSGDGSLATLAQFNYPAGLNFDHCENLYITDINNRRVRKVTFNPSCTLTSLNTAVTNIPENISIYPNPVNEDLQIDNVPPNTGYKLHNVMGILQQHGHLTQGNNTISLQQLPPGMYMLVLTDEVGKKTVKKIIKE